MFEGRTFGKVCMILLHTAITCLARNWIFVTFIGKSRGFILFLVRNFLKIGNKVMECFEPFFFNIHDGLAT